MGASGKHKIDMLFVEWLFHMIKKFKIPYATLHFL
jgi:hypothetical protein